MSKYTSPATYFSTYDKVQGVKADVERHLEEERRLREEIAKSEGDDRRVRVYRYFLSHLLSSKAQVVNQIGK